jgi:ABC-type antimicrobial peptide transport system permease subunit
VLNIGGLAIVLAISTLLFWWVKDEFAFNRMHSDTDRTYRINAHFGKGDNENSWTVTPAPIAVAARKSLPGVEQVIRISDMYDFKSFRVNGRLVIAEGTDLGYADEHFLDLFDGFTVLHGQAGKPFPTPNSVVLTESMATKFFGTADVVGKSLTAIDSNRIFTVGAVLADIPDNSSIRKKMFFPMALRKRLFGGNGDWKVMDDDWGNYSFETYLKVRPNTDWRSIGPKLTQIQHTFNKEVLSDYLLQPLTQLNLYAADGKDTGMQQVRMMGLVGVLLLFIGCINYVNLTTARATRRAREISVRKIVGAESKHLITQLLAESFLTLLIALTLALILIQGLIPFYQELSGKTRGLSLLDPQVWFLLLGMLVITMLLSGVYPALTIASFNPIRALRGRNTSAGQAGLRQGLVVVQFALATGLIISTLVISGQLTHIRERNLGFDKEHIFLFYGGDKADLYKRELAKENSVLAAIKTTGNILQIGSSTGDVDWDGKAPGRSFMVQQFGVEADFLTAYGIRLAAGQNFDGTPADSTHFILNETAVKQSGIQNPIGKRLKFHETEGQIIGVVKDFVTGSARETITPLVLYSWPQYSGMVQVKTRGTDASKALAAAEKIWKKENPDYPFEYRFLDETYDRMYRADQQTGQLFTFFAGVAIVVCCLGLFGLAAYTAEQRTKEIGVRKVLGASVASIVGLLSRDFLKLVFVAILIAAPLAWWAMNQWLQGFNYRIQVSWYYFALAGVLAILIAFATVSYQSILAALVNPVKSLRSE